MGFFSNWTIKARLSLLALLAICATVVVGGFGLSSLISTNRHFKTTYEDRILPLPQLKAVADMYAVNIVDTSHKVRNGNLTWDAGLRNINEAQRKIREEWKAYTGTFLTDDEKVLVKAAESKMQEADRAIEKLKAILGQQNSESLTEFTIRDLYPALDPVSENISDLVNLQLSEAKKSYEASKRDYDSTLIAVISGILVAAALVVGFAATLISSIGAALKEAIAVSQRIAAGDLASNIPTGRKDEIGQLLDSFGKMRTELRSMISRISEGATAISGAATQLSAASEQVAAGSQEQSDAAASMSAAVEQMTVSIGHVASSAEEAHAIAKEAGGLAQDGGRVVLSAATEMSVIADSVSHSASIVETLGENSHQISTVVGVIKEIADQTNLLALNAAIEAARAGEHGRGFAVVADEVRKLAERTTQSTQEISAMIVLIQSDTGRAVEGMREGNTRAAESLTMARKAGDSISGITDGTNRVVLAISDMSDAMQEQRAASDQIAQNVEKIAHMAEENSAAIGEVAGSARRMENLANDLRTSVQRFRV